MPVVVDVPKEDTTVPPLSEETTTDTPDDTSEASLEAGWTVEKVARFQAKRLAHRFSPSFEVSV